MPTRIGNGRQIRIGAGVGEEAGEQRAQGAADGVDAEGVERVVVPSTALSFVQARKGTTPAAIPMMTAPLQSTKPQAGVITTRPATAPEQKPSTLGLPRMIHSAIGQTRGHRGGQASWS